MSGQPSVLQVVILRDGLLVGTEVFVPGTYSLGSDPASDLRLDDPSVESRHALLYFQNGRAAIQDAGSTTGLFVNGHRVSACEIRSVDEVLCGPFVLKTRVLAQRPQEAKPQPPPEVAAMLAAAQPPPPGASAPQQPAAVRQLRAAPAPQPQPLATTVPAVRAVPQAPPPQQPALRPVPPQQPAQRVGNAVTQAAYAPSPAPQVAAPNVVALPQPAQQAVSPMPVPGAHAPWPSQQQAPVPVPAGTLPSVRRRATQEQPQSDMNASMLFADDLLADVTLDPLPDASGPLLQEHRPTATRPTHAPRVGQGKGAAQLYLELYWGAIRKDARRFKPDSKKPVQASVELPEAMPLWGFTLPDTGAPFTLAESLNGAFRLFVPPGTEVEKSGNDGRFAPVTGAALESDGNRRFLTLRQGTAARLTQGQMSLVAYAAPKPERVWVNPLRGMPWLALACFILFGGAFAGFLALKPATPETADFTQRNLPPVALRLIAPEPKKKEEAKKKLEALKQKAPKPVKEKVAEKAPPKPVEKTPPPQPAKAVAAAPPESRALKALAKLSAAGPATNDLLAAVDKLGSGPGSKNVKNSNYKLSGLIGKAPIANAGLGTFGLGGGGKGGGATLGAELLRGKGGGGIGALGAGGVGKGKVGGTVTRATARSIASTQGTVDREAVARVINSHLNEVHGCYERALLKNPGLAGKVVLEWTIGAAGRVVAAKTKSSTLSNAAVEACILSSLKGWTFPAPKGGVVIITYPFLFNSVGY
ncbi:AgmX/PglI C-terminal domain-containing protein [Pyxidicoccus xibeiensis]|uniref:AgmX/PglI C-terminal domain-containing protein n=1 Tax=Pyxidicoccus xibeiensis TaxID=2906759 RepID=UPI0020A7C9AE|nr:AgmX/PglI C-terminal domain-containing protein [Pyxidicoccus xibeiensis]MCP3139000.1 AgmX/PglI C-terminal domain-containing protein [Pyxidicoccus xibeiensis]